MTTSPRLRHVAVIDVGKTNAKLALVNTDTMTEVAVITQPNTVLRAPPFPHFDLEWHWTFFLNGLAEFHATHGIDAISVTTHGAAAVLLKADGTLAAPLLDYEFDGPDTMAPTYDGLRPSFEDTGSPRLAGGLNIGAQLHWLFATDPDLHARTAHIVTYPQYWGFRLTGALACDVTSLGCHTDLWTPASESPSDLVQQLDIAEKLAPAKRPSEVLGTVTKAIADKTGLPETTPVACGIHDSNASLVPYLTGAHGPQSVVSTGTWVICMAMNAVTPALDPTKDTLINVNAHGHSVPTARFMGGREYVLLKAGADAPVAQDDREAVLTKGVMVLPAIAPESGPFAGRTGGWTVAPDTPGQRAYAVALYLALMTEHCLSLINAANPVVVEGPFAKNHDVLRSLATLRKAPVLVSAAATGTAIGAAMLLAGARQPQVNTVKPMEQGAALDRYQAQWSSAINSL